MQVPLDELFPDFPSASASIQAAMELGFQLQVRLDDAAAGMVYRPWRCHGECGTAAWP